MNARNYRVNLKPSPLNFPSIIGLGESSIIYKSGPHIDRNNLKLSITKSYVLIDLDTSKK